MLTKMLQSNLKALLDARRMTIREFSRRINYRFETVRQLANNDLLRVPVELIERVCLELNITPNDLFTITAERRERLMAGMKRIAKEIEELHADYQNGKITKDEYETYLAAFEQLLGGETK